MRIYLASSNEGMGAANRKIAIQKYHPVYLLESFFNGVKACDTTLKDVGNGNFLLDSGAFSFMNSAAVDLPRMEAYIEKYIEYIRTRKIKYYFEIDVDSIFGIGRVEAWRDKIERETGTRCIPVWHKTRGVAYWKQMCREYQYIAIGGLVLNTRKQEYDLIRKLVEYAYHQGVKVHGLGFTKTKELEKYRFWSVDSASWTRSAAIGQQKYTFRNGRLYASRLDKGEIPKKVDIQKLVSHNMGEWVKYQKYMDGVRY